MRSLPLWQGCFAVATALWVLLVLLAPAESLATWVPDDAFYYLTIARNKWQLGTWTFDGTTPTSGYHVFHMLVTYGLVALTSELGVAEVDLWLLPRALSVYGVVLWAGSVLLVRVLLIRTGWPRANAFTVLLLFLSYSGFAALNVLESVEVIALSSLATVLLLGLLIPAQHDSPIQQRRLGSCLVAVALVMPLVRTDLIVLVAVLAAVGITYAAVFAGAGWNARRLWAVPGVRYSMFGGLAGAVGFLMVCWFSYAATGNFQQDSARMKMFWLEASSFSLLDRLGRSALTAGDAVQSVVSPHAFSMGADAVGSWPRLLCGVFIVGCLLSVLVVAFRSRTSANVNSPSTRLVLIALITFGTLTCYSLLLGSLVAQAQPAWYYVPLQLPMALLVFEGLRLLVEGGGSVLRRLGAGICAAAVLTSNLVATANVVRRGYWPSQIYFVQGGEWLRDHCTSEVVGAWNAGMIGYFSGRLVKNLDGLVNTRIYDYARRRAVLDYLVNENVDCIVDYAQAPRARSTSLMLDVVGFDSVYEQASLGGPLSVWLRRDSPRIPVQREDLTR